MKYFLQSLFLNLILILFLSHFFYGQHLDIMQKQNPILLMFSNLHHILFSSDFIIYIHIDTPTHIYIYNFLIVL